ncbi:MAG: P-loop NTPase fold protein, partial [Cetobacterium sp.]
MFDGVIFIFVCSLTFLLGIILNKGLSATNIFKGINEWTHDIPYIFTIGFNEMILIIYMTISIFTLFYIKYIISDSSRKQIKNMLDSILKIELLIFSFITGTWWTTLNVEELKKIDKNLYPIIIIGLILYKIISHYSSFEKKIFENDLYESREALLKIIDHNIENSNRFSIVGDWGIGKSKLIENFFKGKYSYIDQNKKVIYFKDKYKHIYLDVSSYSNNQKILEVLEKELNITLKEAKILKLDKKISKEIFNISSGCFNFIKNFFISEKALEDSKETLDKKIKEYQ